MYVSSSITPNGLQLQEVGDFTANADAENQSLINHKCVCEELNPAIFAKPLLAVVLLSKSAVNFNISIESV